MKQILLVLTTAALLSACHVKIYSTPSDYNGADWSSMAHKDSVYVANQSIYVGMPRQHVIDALGYPSTSSNYGAREIMSYSIHSSNYRTTSNRSYYKSAVIEIEDGVVARYRGLPGSYTAP